MTSTADSPYRLESPAAINFSGGRTSAYMLWHILGAHGGTLPSGVHVLFCNTGKERTETLDFVERCSQRWAIDVVWLEYRIGPDNSHSTAEVNYATASRSGEPFEQLIRHNAIYRDRNGLPPVLPNPVQRFCTSEMKIRRARDWMKARGYKTWSNALGLRADEPRRVANVAAQRERWVNVCPLAKAGVTETDVMAWWKHQPFNLHLQQHEGNCDLCFLKSADKVSRIIRNRPELADWWIEQERWTGQRFRNDRPSVSALAARSIEQPEFRWGDESMADCHCTD